MTGNGLFNSTNSNTTGKQSRPITTTFSFGASNSWPIDTSSGISIFGTPVVSLAPSSGSFGQQSTSIVEMTGNGLFNSTNSNTTGKQSRPITTTFSFGASNEQSTDTSSGISIFGTPSVSLSPSRGGPFGQQSTSIAEMNRHGLFNSINSNTTVKQSMPITTTFSFGASNSWPTNTSTSGISIFGTPTVSVAPNRGRFGQQSTSIVEMTGHGTNLTNSNTTVKQSKPITTTFSFGVSNSPPTDTSTSGISIFGTPAVSLAPSRGSFGQQSNSIVEMTGHGTNSNITVKQSKPITTFSFGVSNSPPTDTSTSGISIFGTPAVSPAPSRGSFRQQSTSKIEMTEHGTNSTNSNTTVKQSRPITTTFSFGASNSRPTDTSTSGILIFETPAVSLAPSGGLFGRQQNTSIVEMTEHGLFNSKNFNTTGKQSKPITTTFSFGASNSPPIDTPTSGIPIFGTPVVSLAPSSGSFGQQSTSIGEMTGHGLFNSTNSNTTIKQSNPITTTFSFGAYNSRPAVDDCKKRTNIRNTHMHRKKKLGSKYKQNIISNIQMRGETDEKLEKNNYECPINKDFSLPQISSNTPCSGQHSQPKKDNMAVILTKSITRNGVLTNLQKQNKIINKSDNEIAIGLYSNTIECEETIILNVKLVKMEEELKENESLIREDFMSSQNIVNDGQNEISNNQIDESAVFLEDNTESAINEDLISPQPSPDTLCCSRRCSESKKKIARDLNKITKLLMAINEQKEIEKSENNNDVDLFFRSILLTVKKYPKHVINNVKMKIVQIVSDLEERYLISPNMDISTDNE